MNADKPKPEYLAYLRTFYKFHEIQFANKNAEYHESVFLSRPFLFFSEFSEFSFFSFDVSVMSASFSNI